jgi:hypothetical protein
LWSKLDDGLQDHPKLFAAGDALGHNGTAIALGVYTFALMYSNRQLTDGYLPLAMVKQLPIVDRPLAVASALVAAGLWEKVDDGYRIHDFLDHNWTRAHVKQRRQADLKRKQNGHQTGRRHLGKKR